MDQDSPFSESKFKKSFVKDDGLNEKWAEEFAAPRRKNDGRNCEIVCECQIVRKCSILGTVADDEKLQTFSEKWADEFVDITHSAFKNQQNFWENLEK